MCNTPIADLFTAWKKENSIRTKLFKNLSSEQQQQWIQYFDENKDLSLSIVTKPEKSNEKRSKKTAKH